MDYFVYSRAKKRFKQIKYIKDFPCIREFGHEKYLDIRPNYLAMHYNKGIEVCYISKGKYEWNVEDEKYMVYPGNGFVTCPWQFHGSEKGVVELGEIMWLIITPKVFTKKGNFHLADWSCFSKEQERIIGHTLVNNTLPVLFKCNELQNLFSALHTELIKREFGYKVKVNHRIRNIIILSKPHNTINNVVFLSIDDVSSKISSVSVPISSTSSLISLTSSLNFNDSISPL